MADGGKTLYKIENGIFQKMSTLPKDYEERYKLINIVDDAQIYDFDKHKLRPYIRDYIARHGQSIEFTYVKYVLFVSIFCLLFAFLGYRWGSSIGTELQKTNASLAGIEAKISTQQLAPNTSTNARPRTTN